MSKRGYPWDPDDEAPPRSLVRDDARTAPAVLVVKRVVRPEKVDYTGEDFRQLYEAMVDTVNAMSPPFDSGARREAALALVNVVCRTFVNVMVEAEAARARPNGVFYLQIAPLVLECMALLDEYHRRRAPGGGSPELRNMYEWWAHQTGRSEARERVDGVMREYFRAVGA